MIATAEASLLFVNIFEILFKSDPAQLLDLLGLCVAVSEEKPPDTQHSWTIAGENAR
jgi:hypothetical protein